MSEKGGAEGMKEVKRKKMKEEMLRIKEGRQMKNGGNAGKMKQGRKSDE